MGGFFFIAVNENSVNIITDFFNNMSAYFPPEILGVIKHV